ncbi:MAG: hypothetical protein WCZ08_02060 [Parcubacteria group bacterium]|jgi:hypothetical protein|nr:hypothetical protein [Candidatus Moranbacteria bacterium]
MKDGNFSKLDKKFQEDLCTIPQIVFVTQNPDDETYEQAVEKQEKFLKLPENVKDKLVSYETADKIKNIGKHYNLNLLQMAPIARIVRSYYFGEVKEEEFADVLAEEIGIDRKSAEEIARYVVERIINTEVRSLSTEKIVKLTLMQAIEKYPEIQDQIISEGLLKLQGKENLVKGSIRNWIRDYYNTVGAGNTDLMKRSSYIYYSQNSKNISNAEKQKLSVILKSLDENVPLEVDLMKKEIVFKESASARRPVKNFTGDIKKNIQKNYEREDIYESKDENPNRIGSGGDVRPAKNKARINQVQGNRFNLKSDYFGKSGKKSDLSEELSRREREGLLRDGGASDTEDNVKFSTPQQFPYEKEIKEEDKGKNRSDFLRRIRPI